MYSLLLLLLVLLAVGLVLRALGVPDTWIAAIAVLFLLIAAIDLAR